MYNKFHNANCSHGYGEPIWITICIQSVNKNRHDESSTRRETPTIGWRQRKDNFNLYSGHAYCTLSRSTTMEISR